MRRVPAGMPSMQRGRLRRDNVDVVTIMPLVGDGSGLGACRSTCSASGVLPHRVAVWWRTRWGRTTRRWSNAPPAYAMPAPERSSRALTAPRHLQHNAPPAPRFAQRPARLCATAQRLCVGRRPSVSKIPTRGAVVTHRGPRPLPRVAVPQLLQPQLHPLHRRLRLPLIGLRQLRKSLLDEQVLA